MIVFVAMPTRRADERTVALNTSCSLRRPEVTAAPDYVHFVGGRNDFWIELLPCFVTERIAGRGFIFVLVGVYFVYYYYIRLEC